VVLYHGEISWTPGGFLGVEVFFVISGYLITALLLAEWKRTASDGGRPRIALGEFWRRRARRLLPALFLLLAACAVVTLVWHPEEIDTFRRDALAALGYVTNWYSIFADTSYFEGVGRPPLLQHLWSLAVEEQFYLVWPLLFVGGMRVLGRRWMLVAVLAAAAGSVLLMRTLFDPAVDPTRVYYGTDTRAAGLLFGCALAFVWSPWRLRARTGPGASWFLDAIGLIALARLGHIVVTRDEFDPWIYTEGITTVSLLTVVVIAVAVHPAAHLGRLLGMRPLVWVGKRSYGIYLWHWPVMVLTRPGLDVDLGGAPLFGVRVGITVVLAEISYRVVEVPIRQGAIGRWLASFRRRRTRVAAGATGRAPWGLRIAGSVVAVVLLASTSLLITALVTTDPAADEVEVELATSQVEEIDPSALPPVPTTSTTVGTAPVDTSPDTAPETTTTTAAPVDDATWLAAIRLTAVGDSVMLGAKPSLEHVFPLGTVDAAVGRAPLAGISLLQGRNGDFGDVVVVHLGNNGMYLDDQFDQLMTMLSGVKRVVVVNVKLPRRYEGEVNGLVAADIGRYPNAVLADWYGYSSPHPEWFYSDGMHLRPEGQAAYTHLIASTLLANRPDGIVVPTTTTTTTLPPPTVPPTTVPPALPPTTVPPAPPPEVAPEVAPSTVVAATG
jgi:peptidoglycan/LPS O-acetylase OafA/YrhL